MMNKKEQAQQEMLRFMKQWRFLVDITMMHLPLMKCLTEICQVNLEEFI